jgi:hypothetical protein
MLEGHHGTGIRVKQEEKVVVVVMPFWSFELWSRCVYMRVCLMGVQLFVSKEAEPFFVFRMFNC